MDIVEIPNDSFENENMPDDKTKEKIFILTKIKKHKNWTREEDKMLIEVANKFKQKSWTKVALYFKDKNPAQCRARYKRIRPGIVKGAWTREEDQLIIDLVEKSGKNWAHISKMMPTRNGKQIRDRFLNYLDPHINKIKFSDDDDRGIIDYYKIHGTKWSKIAKFFPGRTGDMIKNRFYSCLKRKVHIYDVSTNKRIRKKYYKSKRPINSVIHTENPCNSSKKEIKLFSNKNNFITGNNKSTLTNNEIKYNNNSKEKTEKEIEVVCDNETKNNSSEMERNINVDMDEKETHNLNFISPECKNSSSNLGINNHINFLFNTNSNINSENNLIEAYYNLLIRQQNYDSSINETIAKNLENINNFNMFTLSKILKFKSQFENGQNNFNNNLQNINPNFFNTNINSSPSSNFHPQSQSELLFLMGLNYNNHNSSFNNNSSNTK